MKISSTSTASARSLLGVAIILLIFFAIETNAKRGCSAFGHSCFGGHGKRSDPSDRLENTIQDDLSPSQENNQNFETPRWRTRGGGEILIADGGQIYQNRPMPRDEPPQHSGYNLSPFIRQLLAPYRSANSVDFETK